jgi:Fe2+ or Zn2+ uptake regulation protein
MLLMGAGMLLRRSRHQRVGYATVYRTLKLLVDSGLASEIRPIA